MKLLTLKYTLINVFFLYFTIPPCLFPAHVLVPLVAFLSRQNFTFLLSLSVISGDHLKVCPQGFSCCTLEMEEKLSQQSRTDLKAPVHQLSSNLQNTFTQRHSHFDRQYSSYQSNQSECFVCHLKRVLQYCWFISC